MKRNIRQCMVPLMGPRLSQQSHRAISSDGPLRLCLPINPGLVSVRPAGWTQNDRRANELQRRAIESWKH